MWIKTKKSTLIQLSTLKLNLWIPFSMNNILRKSVILEVRIFFSATESLFILLLLYLFYLFYRFYMFSFDMDLLLLVFGFRFLDNLFQNVHLVIISSGLGKFLLKFLKLFLFYCRKLF